MAPTITSFLNSLNAKMEPGVQQHLKNVYACLAASTLAAGAGSMAHMFTNIFQSGFLSAIGAVVLFVLLMATAEDSSKKIKQRLGYLLGFAFLSGVGMGPLLEQVMFVNPSIISSALFGTSVVFVSFTLCSLLSVPGKWLYLGSMLMTILNGMLLLSLANIFVGSQLLFQAHIYLGLIMMCGFVLYDTQLIMEKRRMGNKDFVTHSLDLFIDFIGIFKRLVILLMQKEEEPRRRRN